MYQLIENHSLLSHNTFHLPAIARFFIEYSNEKELIQALNFVHQNNLVFLQIGGGSNLLFTSDFKGVILHSNIQNIEIVAEDKETVILKIGAGVVWDNVVDFCVKNGFYGSENLSLIPGETGAAAVQNIGAYGVEIKDLIEHIEAINVHTGEKKIFSNDSCQYAYRESIFKKEEKGNFIITQVVIKLSKVEKYNLNYGNIIASLPSDYKIDLNLVRETIIKIRESKLPNPELVGNAGSFFMNPYLSHKKYSLLKTKFPQMPHYPVSDELVKVPAAWLIEQCEWKGKTLGGAAVHDKQCLVIINKGDATALDIIELSSKIRTSVAEKFDIELTPEVIFI
ncbi:MAG: UDP-N-acetylmuramate dehydrogenase [Bacteroidales bacterium]|nr:UDP-N-acetylmuramate dehydrogenase [Bacteroidales bacterium]